MRKAHSANTAFWLKKVAAYGFQAGTLAKTAGSAAGNDIPFEQAFSNLAHAYLRDSAPTLLDHELGFQLLDRNEDNNKAIGVFGFKVGSSLLLAPVFFLNGNLKGHELLYLKNQDMFVPLQENWVNDILNKKPNILGSGVGRNSSSLGMVNPDLSRLSQSPSMKQGSANPTFRQLMDESLPLLAKAATTDIGDELQKLGKALHLPTFLKQAGLRMIEKLVETLQDYPELAVSLDQFHGLHVVEDAIKAAGARARTRSIFAPEPLPTTTGSIFAKPHPIKTGALKILHYDSTINTVQPAELTEEEAEQLAKDKLLIKDHRKAEEVSVPYSVQVEQKLQNPQETGLYDVLVRQNKFEKCLVIINGVTPGGPLRGCTLVRVEGEKNWMNCPTTEVWTTHQYDKAEFKKWFESLSVPDSLSKSDNRYILIGPNGEATAAFRVYKEYDNGETDKVYDADFDDYIRRSRPQAYDPDGYQSWADGSRIHLKAKKGDKITSSRGDIYVPDDFRILQVNESKADKDEDKDDCQPMCGGPSSGGSDSPPINPGDLLDVQTYIFNQMPGKPATKEQTEKDGFVLGSPKLLKQALAREFPSLSLAVDGPSVTINEQRFHHRDALVHLVRDHGFREKTARELLGRAQHRNSYTCHVKYAEGSPYLTDSGPVAPGYEDPGPDSGNFMNDSVQTRYQDTQINEVPSLSGRNTDPEIYNPNTNLDRPVSPQDVQSMQAAAQSGQQEVFDASAIGSMLKAVRDDTMVDRYLGPMLKGLDSLGRILFMFYWHGDRFADRFGKQDMPELEDSLRNSFESLGDVIIFLKQKSIEPYPEEAQGEVDLAAASGN
jgi:hypothetical protein